MAKGLALNAENDLIISGTEFTRTNDAPHLAQKLRSRLQLISGESQLDPTEGIPYFTDIFVKPVDLPGAASLFKSVIINTVGVSELLKFDYDLDFEQRQFTINFSVNTVYGEINVNDFTINTGV